MADVTISNLTPGKPSNSAVIPYSEGGVTKAATVSNFGVPVGAVFHLATSTVPVGYLKCNGDTVPNGSGTVQGITADFSALYATLGSTYGSAGKMPDLRGQFVRGFDDGRGVDTGRTMGSGQADAFQGHEHVSFPDEIAMAYSGSGRGLGSYNIWYGNGTTSGQTKLASDGVNGTPRAGSETRPKNVALMAVIKY